MRSAPEGAASAGATPVARGFAAGAAASRGAATPFARGSAGAAASRGAGRGLRLATSTPVHARAQGPGGGFGVGRVGERAHDDDAPGAGADDLADRPLVDAADGEPGHVDVLGRVADRLDADGWATLL